MPQPPRHPDLAVALLEAFRESLKNDPRAQRVAQVAEILLPETSAQIRDLGEHLPDVVACVRQEARHQFVKEAAQLDRAVRKGIAGALDELLTAARARAPRAKRLTTGSRSKARQAARKGRAK